MKEREILDQYSVLKRKQRILSTTATTQRNAMLFAIASKLETSFDKIKIANEHDINEATKEKIADALIKRLVLDKQKLAGVCQGIRDIAKLPDPIGAVKERRLLDDNLLLERIAVPIGVIGMIFESRPDALVQILSLALKSGNAIILKGGREALNTNRLLVELIREALSPFEAGSDWIVHLEKREDVKTLLELDTIVDLLIPRGSNEFVRYVMNNTKIPVLGHADGLCAMYIDKDADLDLAVKVATDAKCQYPAVCNAIETLLVNSSIAQQFLPKYAQALKPYNVKINGDEQTQKYIECNLATEEDYMSEYLDYEITIKVVDSLEEAIEHIAYYGSGHTDAIITKNEISARRFLLEVDSADVFWNCSTRFADGFRFGLGAEVGISTQKIHARGPVGLDGLVTDKWVLKGEGQIVDSYEKGVSHYKHETLHLTGESILGGSQQ